MATTESTDGNVVGVVWRSSVDGGEAVFDADESATSGGGGSILAESHATVSVVNDADEETLATLTIPAATVAVGDVLIFRASGDYLNNSGGNVQYVNKLKLGATTLDTFPTVTLSGATANRGSWEIEATILCESVTAQRANWRMLSGARSATNSGTVSTGSAAFSIVGENTAAEDLALAAAIVLTVDMDTAHASADMRCHSASLTHLPKV